MRKHLLTTAIAVATTFSTAAHSQVGLLEEVIVTAQKRSQSLTDVPISMSAVTAKSIEKLGVKRLSDLTNAVPNVNISQTSDLNSRITIRGVGAQSRNIGFDTRVGVYLDGVYLGQSPALNQELGDLEQIEILRGPQGTLFGKNTVAGAINLITAAPSTEEFFGSVTASVGNYDLEQIKANVNIPITDSVAFSISANDMKRDGPTKNLYNGDYVGDRNVTNYRAQLKVDATDWISARIAFDNLDSDQTSLGREPISDILGGGVDTNSPRRHEINMNRGQGEQRDVTGTALTLDFALDNGYNIKSISAYRDTDFFTTFDLDFGPEDYAYVNYADDYQQLTQEFQLISPEYDNFNYVVGLYYYQQESYTSREVELASEVDQFLSILTPGESIDSIGGVDTTSYAVFANGSYDLSDDFQLTLGFRYSEEEKEVDWILDGSAASFFVGTGAVNDSRRDTDFSPSAALNYFASDEITFYARIATGFKSGGYNLDYNDQVTVDTGTEFDKETVISYELGVKGELFERVQFSTAIFQSIYDDYQVNQLKELQGANGLPSGTSYSIENAAKVETKGIEAEATIFLTESFSMQLAAGYLDAEFDSYPNGGSNGEDYSGNDLVRAPDFTGSIGLDYEKQFDSLTLVAHIDYSYTDDVFVGEENVSTHSLSNGDTIPFGTLDSHYLVNARLGIESADQLWSIAIWGQNLTDEEFLYSSASEFLGTISETPNMPRTYGVDFTVNF